MHFACTQCGRCCTGKRGYVWLDESEIQNLAQHLQTSVEAFGRKYLRRVGSRYALLENAATGECVFLLDQKCRVYEARPKQCRSFPFWPQNLANREAWAATARDCEGIDLD